MSAQATCAWGEGPDVLVTVDRHNASGFGWSPHPEDTPEGRITAGSFGLTVDEALALAGQMAQSAVRAATLAGGYAEAGLSATPALLAAAEECGTSWDNPDTCGVCHKHFDECEEEQHCVGDEFAPGRDIPLGREPACPGARVRAALAARVSAPPRNAPDTRKTIVRFLNERGCTVMSDKDGRLIVVLPDHLVGKRGGS
jgi:hypothetical protein